MQASLSLYLLVEGRQTQAKKMSADLKEGRYFQLLTLPLLLQEPLVPREVRKNSLISLDYGSRRKHLQLHYYALLQTNIRRERLKCKNFAVHYANLTFSGAFTRSLNILKLVAHKTTAQTLAKRPNGLQSHQICCERIQ